jgi:hypothetical protein
MLVPYPVSRLHRQHSPHSLRIEASSATSHRQGVNFGRLPAQGVKNARRAMSSLLPLSRREGTNEKASSHRSDDLGATLRI